MTQITIEVVSTVIIYNNRIIIPVTLDLHPTPSSSNVNIAQAYRNMFTAIKYFDTLGVRSNRNIVIRSSKVVTRSLLVYIFSTIYVQSL